MSSIVFGPQGYVQPPVQPPVTPAVEAAFALPLPQPAQEVTASTAHDGAGTSRDDADDKDGSYDRNAGRRGRLLDIRG